MILYFYSYRILKPQTGIVIAEGCGTFEANRHIDTGEDFMQVKEKICQSILKDHDPPIDASYFHFIAFNTL